MTSTLNKTALVWLFQPAADDTVDPLWELRKADYTDTGVSVQNCTAAGLGYWVNYVGGGAGHVVSTDHRTLGAAKTAAEAFYHGRKVPNG